MNKFDKILEYTSRDTLLANRLHENTLYVLIKGANL